MRVRSLISTLAVVVAACGGSTGSATTTTSSAPEPEPTTTSAVSTTTTTAVAADPLAAVAEAQEALLGFIEEHGTQATLESTGLLSEVGAFVEVDDEDGPSSLEPLDIRAVLDDEGTVWFAVFGSLDDLARTWIEFDALAEDGFTVGAETSIVGAGEGPPWVEDAPMGDVILLEAPAIPSISGVRQTPIAGDLDGYLLVGNFGRSADGLFLPRNPQSDTTPLLTGSLWQYRAVIGTIGAAYAYSHHVVVLENLSPSTGLQELVEKLEGVVAAAADVDALAAELRRIRTESLRWILHDPGDR